MCRNLENLAVFCGKKKWQFWAIFLLKGFIIYVVENLWEKIPNIIIILPKIRIWEEKKKKNIGPTNQ